MPDQLREVGRSRWRKELVERFLVDKFRVVGECGNWNGFWVGYEWLQLNIAHRWRQIRLSLPIMLPCNQ